jgi:hypothetical protein
VGVVLQHIQAVPVPPHEAYPELKIPLQVSTVILKAMEKEPARRYANAQEMHAALLVLAGVRASALARFARPIFSAALPGLLLYVLTRRNGTWGTPAVLALVILCAWSLADRWIPRVDGPRAPLALLVTATGVSLASLFCHSALIATLAGALATCLGATVVLTLLVPAFRLRESASGAIVLVLAGCLVNAGFFAFPRLSVWSALLLCCSLLAPSLLDFRSRGGERIHGSWKDAALAAGLALVPAALAVWIAWTPGEEAL